MKTTKFELNYLDGVGRRMVHSTLLKNLRIGRVYKIYIMIGDEIYGGYNYENMRDEELRMVNGGDLGNNELSEKMWN